MAFIPERTDSEMNFENIEQAADEAGKDLPPTEKGKFKKYCEGLEKAMKDKADLSGLRIIVAVDLLLKQLSSYKQSKPRIKTFWKKLEHLKKMMVDGGRFQFTPRIETPVVSKTKAESRSPMHTKQQLENSNEQTTANLTVDGKSAVEDKGPGSNKHREHAMRNEHKTLTSQLQDSEKRILKIWMLLGNGNDASPEPITSDALNKLEAYVTETKQSFEKQTKEAKSLEEELEKLEEKLADLSKMKIKQKNKIESPSQRVKDIGQAISKWRNEDKSGKDSESKVKQLSSTITKVWLQIKSGNDKTKDNGGDSIAMLGELESLLKENKALIDRFRSIEEAAHQEINLLKQDIETLHDDKRSPVIHETKTDPALVRSLKQLRKDLLLKKYSSQKKVSELQRMHDMGCDELRSNVTDVCAFCATDGKLNPALYFCKDCSKFGRYICGICNKNHDRFTNNHNVERIFTV